MNWEQKIQALQSLSGISLKMRKPGDWYVHFDSLVEIAEGYMLCSPTQLDCATPEEAVEQCWKQYTELDHDNYYIAKDAGYSYRKNYKWNGFMWQVLN